MALYGVRLVINLFDLCIYRRYLEEFIGNRKTSMEFSVLLLIVCELIGSAVNQMGISWLNFMTSLTPYNAMSHSSLHKCDVLFRQLLPVPSCHSQLCAVCKQADCGSAVYGDYGSCRTVRIFV